MKKAYNYTTIRTREKRIYSLAGSKISSTGMTTSFLAVAGITLVIFNIIGAIICLIGGEFYYNPIRSIEDIDFTFLIIFIGLPIGLAAFLNNAKIQNYKVLDYLIMYIKPKYCYNEKGKRIKHTKIKVDNIVENIV